MVGENQEDGCSSEMFREVNIDNIINNVIMKRFFLLMISSVFHVISFSQVELPSYIMKDPTIYSDFKYSNEELQAIQEGNAERILWRTKEYVDKAER